MSAASRKELNRLHQLVCQHLIEKFESGDVQTSDITAASKFLKDNGVEAAFETDDRALEDVEAAMRAYAKSEGLELN